MNVCRSLLLIALCPITQAALLGQVLPGGAVLTASQPIASTEAPGEDALPESPLPVGGYFANQAHFLAKDLPAARPQGASSDLVPSEYGLATQSTPLSNNGRVLRITFTTYDRDGRPTPDVPEVGGSYRSRLASASWDPHRLYSPLVDGFRFSQQEVGEIFTGNLLEGLTSNIKHVFHLGPAAPAQ